MIAGDVHAGALTEVHRHSLAPLREVGEDQHPLAGGEDRLHELLETGELPRTAVQRLVVVLVGRGVVADLFQRGDGRQDRALLHLAVDPGRLLHERVEDRLVQTDLLLGHRAVVELVDLLRKLGRDLRLELRAAEHEDAVQGTEGRLPLPCELRNEGGA